MKTLFLLIVIYIPIVCYSQKEAEDIYQKAYEYSWKYRYAKGDTTILLDPLYDSAIILLDRLSVKYPNYRNNDVDVLYQDCYFNTKKYTQALSYSLKILSRFKTNDILSDDFTYESIHACIQAAKCYLNIGDYANAIKYYDSSETKYKNNLPICGLSYMLNKGIKDRDLFMAYKGLNKPELALEIATPYFFDSTMSEFIDSVYYVNYFNTIRELYSMEVAKKKVTIATDSLKIKLENLFGSNRSSLPKNNWVELFFGKIDLVEELVDGSISHLILDYYSPEYLYRRVTGSIGYKYFISSQ